MKTWHQKTAPFIMITFKIYILESFVVMPLLELRQTDFLRIPLAFGTLHSNWHNFRSTDSLRTSWSSPAIPFTLILDKTLEVEHIFIERAMTSWKGFSSQVLSPRVVSTWNWNLFKFKFFNVNVSSHSKFQNSRYFRIYIFS